MDDPVMFRGRYRIASARWSAWDYGRNAAYFVTICTAGRTHDFGHVDNGEMILTPLGRAAAQCWAAIPDHFPFVVLDAFVVMLNHVDGTIIIDKPDSAGDGPSGFGPQSRNLASIVRGFKIGVTKYARQHDIPFKWQARYHDRVIRNAGEYERIRQYIYENPERWAEDRYYTAQ